MNSGPLPLPESADHSPWSELIADPPEAFWRSLFYFNWYRFSVAAVFLFAIYFYGPTFNLGYENPHAFAQVCLAYLALAVVFYIVLRGWKRWFSLQLTVQVVIDIVVLTLLMYYSGGARSGLTVMMLVVLAGAGLVGQGRLSLFFAALATFAVLIEQSHRVLKFDGDPADFVYSGIVSIGFFATAITARLLARRVVANENLARQRGKELADQLRINERVIRDMQDGVLVVDAEGCVRQFNPQAAVLLGIINSDTTQVMALAHFSSTLAAYFARWASQATEALEILHAPASGRTLQARFLPAGEGGLALIYLEDIDRVQEHARQLKLAALGRLTANMAHEIRNPLSAISHAAELLADEQRDVTRVRLTRIIGDNTQRLNRLVSEVLELGRRDRAQPELLNLKSFAETFLDEFTIHDSRVAELVVLNVDSAAMIRFDRSHLNRVLWNMLGNALRHSKGIAGSVRLNAYRVLTPGNPPRVEVHIVDDGPGIEPEIQAQVFEPFFTTHSSGTGLGLYIARELCEANGAQLELCANSPGAHFCLTGRGE